VDEKRLFRQFFPHGPSQKLQLIFKAPMLKK